jgi:hypothetical protein
MNGQAEEFRFYYCKHHTGLPLDTVCVEPECMYKGMVCSKCVKIAHPHHKTEELRVFLSKLDEFRHISEENDPAFIRRR